MAAVKTVVKPHGDRVLVNIGDDTFLDFDWREALEKGQELVEHARNPVRLRVMANIGRVFLDLEVSAALALGNALIAGARRVEETKNADRVAFDSAILARVGSPFALAMHPKIVEMANLEAVHNRVLRRAMPSIQSQAVVGVPGLIQEAP